MAKYEELLAQRDALEAQINAVKGEARITALAEVKRMVREFDIAEREIYGAERVRQRRRPQAKYRDPETGATWTGRGRAPAWISGKDRDAFVIER
ncbi:H-NS histone family protein [Burkholderia ubonensis]|uniref:Histone n=1 Tax=Burkholderia ubonensis subsp. mesacidophila TaxID=265293 RepID=A0A2A4FCI1_9BURK|nr:H-NS histone family protein [Burkholderia ubonensis]PCE30338.1 histone [Burkholderia ubonensis subsp. mesacidophila]